MIVVMGWWRWGSVVDGYGGAIMMVVVMVEGFVVVVVVGVR